MSNRYTDYEGCHLACSVLEMGWLQDYHHLSSLKLDSFGLVCNDQFPSPALVLTTSLFPFLGQKLHVGFYLSLGLAEAEKYHQFHDDMLDQYGSAYHALRKFADATQCPGDQSSWPFFAS